MKEEQERTNGRLSTGVYLNRRRRRRRRQALPPLTRPTTPQPMPLPDAYREDATRYVDRQVKTSAGHHL